MITKHKIYSADARLLPLLDNSCSLAVTSPPYPMIQMWDEVFSFMSTDARNYLKSNNGRLAYEAMHLELDKVWSELWRVLNPGSILAINIGDATRSIEKDFALYTSHSRITLACEAIGFTALPPIIWRKQTNAPNKFMGSGMLPGGAYVTYEHEYILLFRKGSARRYTPEQAKTRRRSAIFWEERNKWFSDLWEFKGTRQLLSDNNASRTRSAAYPHDLAWRLIHMFSCQGDIVIDPFAGTGTTAYAAMSAGRSSLSVDLDPALASFSLGSALEKNLQNTALDRLEAHKKFVAERQDKLQYFNSALNTPVMTRQELELDIPILQKLSNSSSELELEYTMLSKL